MIVRGTGLPLRLLADTFSEALIRKLGAGQKIRVEVGCMQRGKAAINYYEEMALGRSHLQLYYIIFFVVVGTHQNI
jgi:hypothetical protein